MFLNSLNKIGDSVTVHSPCKLDEIIIDHFFVVPAGFVVPGRVFSTVVARVLIVL